MKESTLTEAADAFASAAPSADFWSLRVVDTQREELRVRQDVLEPPAQGRSTGAMVTVVDGDGIGYAASANLSVTGLARAGEAAHDWARRTGALNLLRGAQYPRPQGQWSQCATDSKPWHSVSLAERIQLLQQASHALKAAAPKLCGDSVLVDWEASLSHQHTHTLLATSDGARIEHASSSLSPGLAAVANRGSDTQRRTHGYGDLARQGGLEQLEVVGFLSEAERVAQEAVSLLGAPPCPTGKMKLLLMPGQMILQLHESVGHPLELDRILGDERNYAGGSFVSVDMFGHYRYGSDLLNVTFDPTVPGQLASYPFDDEGTPARREHLIRNGILQRPLGSASSQARAGIAGVACARATDWNRPAIDRMGNINLEPGSSSMAEMVGAIEHGVLMDTNRSWSIDQQRNKFQFGCEMGRIIDNGELKGVVKNASYRGISATFWRNLDRVGNTGTRRVMGTAFCGKGEPNQVIHVGHASPACVFKDVDVFGSR